MGIWVLRLSEIKMKIVKLIIPLDPPMDTLHIISRTVHVKADLQFPPPSDGSLYEAQRSGDTNGGWFPRKVGCSAHKLQV